MNKIFIAFGSVLLAVPLLAQSSQNTTTPNQNQTKQNQSTASQSTPNQQNFQNEYPSKNEQVLQKQAVSDLGARMLNNTDQAKQALENHDKQDALMYIGRAQRDLEDIRGDQPSQKMIPIYAEVTDVWVLGPALSARHGMNQQTQPQTQGMNPPQQNQAQSSTQPAQGQWQQNQTANANSGVAVRDIRDRYTGIFVDTAGDSAQLQAAANDINQGSYQAAEKALNKVQDSLVAETVRGDRPLMKARENLILAREAASRGDQTEERTAIRAASNALTEYAKEGRSHAQEARQLCQQISQDSSSNISASQIDNWWNEVSDWTTPAARQG